MIQTKTCGYPYCGGNTAECEQCPARSSTGWPAVDAASKGAPELVAIAAFKPPPSPPEGWRDALEFAAAHLSSEWPERCRETVRLARAALAGDYDMPEPVAKALEQESLDEATVGWLHWCHRRGMAGLAKHLQRLRALDSKKGLPVKVVAFFHRFHTDDSLDGKPNTRSWTLAEGEPHPSLLRSGEVRPLVDAPPPVVQTDLDTLFNDWRRARAVNGVKNPDAMHMVQVGDRMCGTINNLSVGVNYDHLRANELLEQVLREMPSCDLKIKIAAFLAEPSK